MNNFFKYIIINIKIFIGKINSFDDKTFYGSTIRSGGLSQLIKQQALPIYKSI